MVYQALGGCMSENALGKAPSSTTASDKKPSLDNPAWLRNKYHAEGLTQGAIAEILGCDSSTVSRAMSRHDIPTRTGGPEVQYPELHNPEWVCERYVAEFMNSREIAEHLGCGRTHAIRAVNKHVPDEQIRDDGPQGNVLDEPLEDEMREIIEGELLGDGCIRNKYDTPTAPFYYETSKEGYRNWLWGVLEENGFNTRTRNRYDKKYTLYRLETQKYRCLKEIYDRWYPNNQKTVPGDFELTPIKLRQWYIGDGSRREGGYVIYAYNFEGEQLERLVDELGENYIEATANNGVLRVRDAWVEDFFDYMAPLPSELKDVYGYKWPDNG